MQFVPSNVIHHARSKLNIFVNICCVTAIFLTAKPLDENDMAYLLDRDRKDSHKAKWLMVMLMTIG
jgi:hypothetical protein